MSWTEERVALLSKLWADGLSASQIAGELGGVTRNAVIGKVHRLGLSGRAKPASSSAKRVKRPRSTYNSKPRTNSRNGLGPRETGTQNLRTIVEDLTAPESKKLSLVELTEKTCKWPEGDPATDDFHFCGNKTKEEAPYCEYHCKLAYQQNIDRRRDKQRANAA
ncbi:MAG: GcrA family cell cycle regulator [Rhizobiaceae bacterium]|nr:GcrA family cell cycle regulator [Rhizobiaceae bacterium]